MYINFFWGLMNVFDIRFYRLFFFEFFEIVIYYREVKFMIIWLKR